MSSPCRNPERSGGRRAAPADRRCRGACRRRQRRIGAARRRPGRGPRTRRSLGHWPFSQRRRSPSGGSDRSAVRGKQGRHRRRRTAVRPNELFWLPFQRRRRHGSGADVRPLALRRTDRPDLRVYRAGPTERHAIVAVCLATTADLGTCGIRKVASGIAEPPRRTRVSSHEAGAGVSVSSYRRRP